MLCVVDDVRGGQMPDEQRRSGIMLPHGFPHGIAVSVGIAVAAEMPAGVVGADVVGDVAGTFLTVVWIRREI